MKQASNSSDVAHHALASPKGMPRKPKKLSQNATGLVHVSLMLEAPLVRAIDEEAERMTAAHPFGRRTTRTDLVKMLLEEAMVARAEKNPRRSK